MANGTIVTRFVTGDGNDLIAPFARGLSDDSLVSKHEVYDAKQRWVARCTTEAMATFLANALNKDCRS